LIETQTFYVKGILKGIPASKSSRTRNIQSWDDDRSRTTYQRINIIDDDDDDGYSSFGKWYLPNSLRKLIRLLNTDDFSGVNNASKNENKGLQTETFYTLRRESKNA